MRFLRQVFTWWNGQTVGTRLFTARAGKFVGEDEAGNRYYRTGKDTHRWVIYADYAEASTVPADWHGWLHRTFELPPTEAPLPRKPWEKDHKANMTGTPVAYRPKGSLHRLGKGPLGDGQAGSPAYEAWQPE